MNVIIGEKQKHLHNSTNTISETNVFNNLLFFSLFFNVNPNKGNYHFAADGLTLL